MDGYSRATKVVGAYPRMDNTTAVPAYFFVLSCRALPSLRVRHAIPVGRKKNKHARHRSGPCSHSCVFHLGQGLLEELRERSSHVDAGARGCFEVCEAMIFGPALPLLFADDSSLIDLEAHTRK